MNALPNADFSNSFVVCALEHRDGSGPRTFVNHAKEGPGSLDELEKDGKVDHSEKQKQQGYDQVVSYVLGLVTSNGSLIVNRIIYFQKVRPAVLNLRKMWRTNGDFLTGSRESL